MHFFVQFKHTHTGAVDISAVGLPHCMSFAHIPSTLFLSAHHVCINSPLAQSWPNFSAPLLEHVNGRFVPAKRNSLFAQETFT